MKKLLKQLNELSIDLDLAIDDREQANTKIEAIKEQIRAVAEKISNKKTGDEYVDITIGTNTFKCKKENVANIIESFGI